MPGVLSKLAYEYNSEEKEEEEKYRFKILSRIIKDDPTQIKTVLSYSKQAEHK